MWRFISLGLFLLWPSLLAAAPLKTTYRRDPAN